MIKNEKMKEILPYDVGVRKSKYLLDANENCFNLTKEIKENISEAFKHFDFNRYPDGNSIKIKEIILKSHPKSKKSEFLIGSGSDEVLFYIFMVFRGKKAYVPEIDYPVYFHLAKIFEIDVIEGEVVENDEGFNLGEGFFKKIKKAKPDIVIISYPNNPIGKCFDEQKIKQSIQENPEVFYVIDEAYSHFSNKTLEGLVQQCDNIMIIRTFSKAFGLASLRIGYAYSNEENINMIKKLKLPFNVSGASQYIFEIGYDNISKHITNWVEYIEKERNRLYNKIKTKYKWIKTYPSETNFLLLRTEKIDQLQRKIEKENFLIKIKFKYKKIENCFRYTIGKIEENEVFLKILEEMDKETNSLI